MIFFYHRSREDTFREPYSLVQNVLYMLYDECKKGLEMRSNNKVQTTLAANVNQTLGKWTFAWWEETYLRFHVPCPLCSSSTTDKSEICCIMIYLTHCKQCHLVPKRYYYYCQCCKSWQLFGSKRNHVLRQQLYFEAN